MVDDHCWQESPPELAVGIEQFNSQQFFECHETLEELWLAEHRPVRQLYQGILQIGVAFYHLQRQRYRPAVTLFERGTGYLQPFVPQCMGVDVRGLLDHVARCLTVVRELGPEGVESFDWSLVPKIETGLERLEVLDG